MRIKTVDLKLGKMRKAQTFVVYPRNGDAEARLKIQSDTYIASIDPQTGEGALAGPHSGGAYFVHLSLPTKVQPIKLTAEQLAEVTSAEAKRGQTIGAAGAIGGGSVIIG